MTAVAAFLALLGIGLTAYALLGGADFGAGLWDLLAGGATAGAPQRARIEHSIGPVWEANHVWLIFVITLFWTGFPPAFAAFASTLYIPLTLVAFGVIARGSAFAFRKASTELWQQRLFGAAFAVSSVVTPFFLGAIAGALASGRVPPGIARGDILTSWWNPTSVLAGVLALVTMAYLAAVYLTRDAQRAGEETVAEQFRRRGLIAGIVAGALALAGPLVLRADAPEFATALTGSGFPEMAVSAVAGVASLVLLWRRRYVAVRITAAVAVTAVIWGWGIAQYPELLPGLTAQEAAADPTVLRNALWVFAVGAVLLIPSMWWMFALFQREPVTEGGEHRQA
ncbi:MAG TPA: cytochrome d ubiquinol oxidase subunit II [Mycobacteriales bacterium]